MPAAGWRTPELKAAAGHGWRAWTAVAAGALLGTELRYGLGLLFPEAANALPWTPLWINVSGSFILATLTTLWMARPKTAFWLRAGIGPGLLGSFTTFSAVVFAVDQQARRQPLHVDGLSRTLSGPGPWSGGSRLESGEGH